MGVFNVIYSRSVQLILKMAMPFINIRIPETHSDIFKIIPIIKNENLNHPLIISGNHVSKHPKIQMLFSKLNENNIKFSLFTNVKSDPTFENIEEIYKFYIDNSCDSIISIGGGSIIDASKALGCKITSPNKNLSSFKGLLKVKKDIPFFMACPTTAGTGSEATIASVVTDEKTNDKFAINDPHLVPNIAILDNTLLDSLSSETIAITGIDALCHAVEAYIGRSNSKLTKEKALDAIFLIKNNLVKFYQNVNDIEARENMLIASYEAGISFTRAYVGYVHALAHAIGGLYHLPHGYCIEILLPYVLEAYKTSIYKSTKEINDYLSLSDKDAVDEEKCLAFIDWIKDLNKELNIPETFDNKIKEDDYLKLAIHAFKEANPIYPVPKILNVKKLIDILKKSNGVKIEGEN